MKGSVKNCVFDLRVRQKVTQEELADAVGVTRQTIIAIEKGNYTPSVLLALKIAKFFKKSVEDIFAITMKEVILGIIVIILLLLVADVVPFWMPDMAAMLVLLGLALAGAGFILFVLREKGSDEREEYHKLLADRFAFLAGSAVILIGIIQEALSHSLNRYLLIALGAMVLAKIAGLLYGQKRH